MTKQKVLEIIDKMPSDFDIEDLFERIIFMEKVEKGIQQLNSGETVTHEEAKNIAKGWGKK